MIGVESCPSSGRTYWPSDTIKIPDFLDCFVTKGISTTYAAIQASYDLTSDHTPVITDYQHPDYTTHKRTGLHIKIVRDKADLTMQLKNREDVEAATSNFINKPPKQLLPH
jgi:hypothetical protein